MLHLILGQRLREVPHAFMNLAGRSARMCLRDRYRESAVVYDVV